MHDFTSPRAPFPNPTHTGELTTTRPGRFPATDKLELFVFYGVILCVFVLLRAGDAYYFTGGGRRPQSAGEEEDEEWNMDSSDDAEGMPAGFGMPNRTISKLSRAQ